MDKQKLQPLKGFRDFLPEQAEKRMYLRRKMEEIFNKFGFEPLITPSLEYQEVLMNKYGEEADKLLYKFEDEGGRKVALRYDQTVPTSRILAMYRNNLPMPWRRYQIQNVWRAEKPQRGRFREFVQCDVDIFGTTSPLSDAELLSVANDTLNELGFKESTIMINDRAILFEVMDKAEIPDDMHLSVIQTIDKLDKLSREEIEEELLTKDLRVKQIHELFDAIDDAKPSEVLQKTLEYAKSLGLSEDRIKFQPYLARGLDYYNSVIYEFKIIGYNAGSVAGGGRYDNLIGKLSGVDIPATGFSWGFDRLLEAMEEFDLLPSEQFTTKALVTVFNKDLIDKSAEMVSRFRANNISAELFPDEEKDLSKQLKYADKKNIKWLIVIGPNEAEKGNAVLKNLESGEQEELTPDKILEKIK